MRFMGLCKVVCTRPVSSRSPVLPSHDEPNRDDSPCRCGSLGKIVRNPLRSSISCLGSASYDSYV